MAAVNLGFANVPFDEKITRLIGELAVMFAGRRHLENEISLRLVRIGYEY